MAQAALHPIELEDLSAFEKIRHAFPPTISEHTFSNLFAWRALRPVSLCIIDEVIIVVTDSDDGLTIFGPPLGSIPIGDAISILEKTSGKSISAIERIPEDRLKITSPDGWIVQEDTCNSDYVYRRQELAELEGRKFHAKRNLIAQCDAYNDWAYEDITGRNIPEVSQMMDRWCSSRNCETDRGLCAEYSAIREMLKNYERLGVLGAAIRIDGKIEAFTIAEDLNNTTAVIHFEKATPEFKGIYQLINREFCKNALSQFEFVNREQDLCVEGLRKSKRSYFPDHMVKKFTVRRSVDQPANTKYIGTRCAE